VDEKYRFIGLVVAVIVIIVSVTYHVAWWDELGR